MMKDLDEAIQHCLEVAEQKEQEAKEAHVLSGMDCLECAKEHRQLAKWLKELKAYREILANADKIILSEYGCVIIEGYRDVIDRMIEIYMEVNTDDT